MFCITCAHGAFATQPDLLIDNGQREELRIQEKKNSEKFALLSDSSFTSAILIDETEVGNVTDNLQDFLANYDFIYGSNHEGYW